MSVPSQSPNASLEELADALTESGIPTTVLGPRRLVVDGESIDVRLVNRAHPTPAELAALDPVDKGEIAVVVSDRLSDTAHAALRSLGIGWLDRRGSVRIWTERLRLDVSFNPGYGLPDRRAPRSFTPAVRDVVLGLLLRPDESGSPRALARSVDRSAGYVSTILAGLEEDGLLRADGKPLLPELFWALADAWPGEWMQVDDTLEDLRLDGVAVATGNGAAEALGAPVLLGAGGPINLIVGSEALLRRLSKSRKAGALDPDSSQVAVRVESNFESVVITNPVSGVRFAHPVVVALDLAEDQRGRETVEVWRPASTELGTLAVLEVYRRAGWVQANWLEDILTDATPEPLWRAAAAACWDSHAEGLAVLYQHPGCPDDLRVTVRRRLLDVIGAMESRGRWGLRRLVDYAPSLLLEEPVRSRDIDPPDSGLRSAVEEAVRSGAPRSVLRDIAQEWLETDEPERDAWATAGEAHYLLRLDPIAVYEGPVRAHLEEVVRRPKPVWHHEGTRRWSEWSSGDDPWWYEFCSRARSSVDNSPADRRRLLNELLTADIDGRAMPIAELLPVLDGDALERALAGIEQSAPAVADLHVRAKVLAVASRYGDARRREVLLDQALVAARAAVEQPGPSLLGGPEPGGIRGLLEVADEADGEFRRTTLKEATSAWLRWVGAEDDAGDRKQRRRDRRMMFHSGGDSTLPLVRMLASSDMAAELRRVFQGLRRVAGDEGNALEGYLAMGAWPALRDGSLELAALFVSEARTETAWRQRQGADAKAHEPESEPPEYPEFPAQLVGYRDVWR